MERRDLAPVWEELDGLCSASKPALARSLTPSGIRYD
jgi:hypothetical protein